MNKIKGYFCESLHKIDKILTSFMQKTVATNMQYQEWKGSTTTNPGYVKRTVREHSCQEISNSGCSRKLLDKHNLQKCQEIGKTSQKEMKCTTVQHWSWVLTKEHTIPVLLIVKLALPGRAPHFPAVPHLATTFPNWAFTHQVLSSKQKCYFLME